MIKIKFFGEPGLIVNDFLTGKKLFQFDENGECEIEREDIIARAKTHFKFEEPIQIEETFKCKKCEFVTTNKGELLAHYKKEHSKEGKNNEQ